MNIRVRYMANVDSDMVSGIGAGNYFIATAQARIASEEGDLELATLIIRSLDDIDCASYRLLSLWHNGSSSSFLAIYVVAIFELIFDLSHNFRSRQTLYILKPIAENKVNGPNKINALLHIIYCTLLRGLRFFLNGCFHLILCHNLCRRYSKDNTLKFSAPTITSSVPSPFSQSTMT